MAYFDFHFHPVFKRGMVEFEDHYPSVRTPDSLKPKFKLDRGWADKIDDELFHILEGQCAVDQLEKIVPVVGFAAIASTERFFTNKKGIFGKLLNGGFTDPMDKTFMDLIRVGEISYYHLFLKELSLYRILADDGAINFITRHQEHKDLLKAPQGINVALAMEGGHGLSRCLIGRGGQRDERAQRMKTADNKPIKETLWKDFIEHPLLPAHRSLEHLQKGLWKEKLDLLLLTITHLQHITEQKLATHAYGMKMIKAYEAYPHGNGLTDEGVRVVESAYDMKIGNKRAPILIDMKHMALKSRLDLYALRRKRAQAGKKNPPLVATHMGVTGYTIEEWKLALKRKSVEFEAEPMRVGFTIERQHAGNWGVANSRFTFNAWTIGLMDDDIEEIVKSDGLIGISLDVRVLGWQMGFSKKDMMEYLSLDDFRHFFPEEYATLTKPSGLEADDIEEESFVLPNKKERHAMALCLNIVHIASVVDSVTDEDHDIWKHICIGSDFDGLIDPVKTSKDVSKIPQLRKDLWKWLPRAQEAYQKIHGGDNVLEKGGDRKALIDRIVYTNGLKFLRSFIN